MKKEGHLAKLRRSTDRILQQSQATHPAKFNESDLQKLVHALQVHQIELEMQNKELRQTRSDLETALSRYTELYDFAPVGYLTLTGDGLIARINLTGAALLGVERRKLANKQFLPFVVPEEQDDWSRHFQSIKTGDAQGTVELIMRRGDDTRFHAQLNCMRHSVDTDDKIFEETAEHDGIRIVLTDISERKRAERERNQALAAAEKANRVKSDFLSSMSHELRTPLNAILGFAQLIESGSPPPTDTQQRSIEQILHAGWYLLELINEILDLALIESGKLALTLEPVALAEVMQECRAMTEPQGQNRGVVVNFAACTFPKFVLADRTRLKQILINLLANGIKYNKPGGTVTVDCQAAGPGRIRIGVRDTGTGMAPDRQAQLFQPFNRLGQEANAQEGTGIGLVLCKHLVELMGGVIGFESAVGKGSLFWIEMNLASEETASSTSLLTIPQPMLTEPAFFTLLYVEDSTAHRMLVEELIARRPDIRLLSAADAEAGIEMARVSQPDIILMDINLPGINGTQALKILALDPATAHIPVIALSANSIPRDIENGLAAGYFRYLTKPIKVNEFMGVLDVALKHARRTSPVSVKEENT